MVLGNIGAENVTIDPGLVISRRIRIAGSGNATIADMRLALNMIARGIVRPMIGRMLSFPEAALAHSLVEQRAVAGRVVLVDGDMHLVASLDETQSMVSRTNSPHRAQWELDLWTIRGPREPAWACPARTRPHQWRQGCAAAAR